MSKEQASYQPDSDLDLLQYQYLIHELMPAPGEEKMGSKRGKQREKEEARKKQERQAKTRKYHNKKIKKLSEWEDAARVRDAEAEHQRATASQEQAMRLLRALSYVRFATINPEDSRKNRQMADITVFVNTNQGEVQLNLQIKSSIGGVTDFFKKIEDQIKRLHLNQSVGEFLKERHLIVIATPPESDLQELMQFLSRVIKQNYSWKLLPLRKEEKMEF